MDYPHLEDLQLADSLNDNCGAIDVLIGSDYYWAKRYAEVVVQRQFQVNLDGFCLAHCVTP